MVRISLRSADCAEKALCKAANERKIAARANAREASAREAAQKAREENEQLKQRIALLEEMLEEFEAEITEPPTPRPVRRQKKVKRSY